ncbi:MAG: hypothetical protein JXQ29_16135 [Planctomycetes bacterium]|nr:hypothetical protein [Planctomycetota bacterium]
MYQFTQKHNKIILIVVCVVLLPFVGFSFYPIMNRITGGQELHSAVGTFEMPAGRVHAVSATRFEETYRRTSRVGPVFGAFPVKTYDDVWLHLTQVAEAAALGVRVSDARLEEFITERIRRPGRLQTVQQYREWLKRLRLSPREFEETLREFLMRLELYFLHQSADRVDLNTLLEQYREHNRKVTVRSVRVGIDQVRATLDPVDFPLKPRLEAFYSDPSRRFLLTAKPELMRPRVFEEVHVLYGYYAKFDPEHAAVKANLKDYEPGAEEIQREYENWKFVLYRDAPVPAEAGTEAPPPAADGFKPLAAVRGDVVKRLKLRRTMELIRAEAEEARAAAERAKSVPEKPTPPAEPPSPEKAAEPALPAEAPPAAPPENPENPENPGNPEVAAPPQDPAPSGNQAPPVLPAAGQDPPEASPTPAGLHLRAHADRYGLEFQRIGPVDPAEIRRIAPFEADVGDVFADEIGALREGQLSSLDAGTGEKLVFLAYLAKDRPAELKPLEAIEDAVRGVAMDEAAREKARELADRFYDALEDQVVAALEPELEKDIRAPLRQQQNEEIAAENAERAGQNKPKLSEEELKTIEERYAQRIKEQETPRIEQAKRDKLGEHFEAVAREQGLEVADFTFYLPWREVGRRPGYDFERERREIERDPVGGFLKYRAGLGALREPGEVTRPVADPGKAVFVLKLAASEPARWEDLDPRTYRRLVEAARRDQSFRLRTTGDPLGPDRLEERYRLKTSVRHRPDAEEDGSMPGQ